MSSIDDHPTKIAQNFVTTKKYPSLIAHAFRYHSEIDESTPAISSGFNGVAPGKYSKLISPINAATIFVITIALSRQLVLQAIFFQQTDSLNPSYALFA